MYEFIQKKWLVQFSLLGFLICIPLVAAGMAFHARRSTLAQRRDQSLESLRRRGAGLRYQHEAQGSEAAPAWLDRLLGPADVHSVDALHFGQETHEGSLASFRPESRLFDDDLELLSDFPEIRELSLITSNVTTDGLVSLRHLRNLESFRFGVAARSTMGGDGRGLAYLSTCPKLRRVFLHDVPLGRPGLSFVYALPSLEELGLVDMLVGDQLEILQSLPGLKTLILSGSDVTDDALAWVAKLTALVTLDLSRTKVTDGGLLALSELSDLKTLNLQHTAVSHEGIAAIKRELPRCTVTWQP